MENITKNKKRKICVEAKGKNYFINPLFPLALSIIRAEKRESHSYDLTCIPHVHDFSELVIVTKGMGTQIVDGEKIPVFAGDVFLMRGGHVHNFTERGGYELYNLQFNPEALPLPVEMLQKLPGYNMIFCVEPSLRGNQRKNQRLHLETSELQHVLLLLNRLDAELHANRVDSQCLAISILLELLVRVSMCQKQRESASDKRVVLPKIAELISRLERDFGAHWTLAEMSSLVCTSTNTLLRLFHAATGKSPIQYLLECRLRNAARLLSESNWSISEIAAHCGFSDSNYLTKRFSSLFHQSPLAFRREAALS